MPSIFKSALLLSVMLTGASLAQTAIPTSVQTRSDHIADADAHRAVAQMSAIKSRTDNKISRFTDTGQREFAVNYDKDGRVQSVMATQQRHLADILAVGYDESGAVRAVSLGNGQQLYYSPMEGGGRVVRDAGGNLVVLNGAGEVIRSDPSNKLAATVVRMEGLLKALQ